MGNYNESDYTDFRWIQKVKEEKLENSQETIIFYSPVPLNRVSSIERDLLRYVKTKSTSVLNEDAQFDIENESYTDGELTAYRILAPIIEKKIYRKNRLNRNCFKILHSNRLNILEEFHIFYFDEIFSNFDIDINDLFIVKFCNHVSLLNNHIISILKNNLISHLKEKHNLHEEKLTFAKLRNIIAKDFIECKNPILSHYTAYYVKNLTDISFQEIISEILSEEGDIYSLINQIVTHKQINDYLLFYLLCLIYIFDTEANQKEMLRTYKSIDTFNPNIFYEGNIISNYEYMTTTKDENYVSNSNNIIEISYDKIKNKNWYLSFKALDLENFTAYKSALEVIIEPNCIFEVRKVKKINDDKYYIKLHLQSNLLNDCIEMNMSTRMQMNIGVCTDIGNDINEMYPGLELEKVVSLTINNKINLIENKINIGCMKNLRVLDMRNIDLNDNDMIDIIPYFTNLTFLSYLNLELNNLEPKSIESLSTIMNMMPYLEYLNINQNNLRDEGTEEITKGLKNIQNLRGISLMYNQIKCKGIETLSKQLSSFSKMKLINFSTNYIYQEEMDNLVSAIGKMDHLIYINLSNNQISSTGLAILGEVLPNSIQRLDFSENEITQEGFMEFSTYMKRIPNLKAFIIYGNKNGPSGISALIDGFKYTPLLEELNFGCNLLGDADILLLMQNIDYFKNLIELNLRENNISSDGIVFLNSGLNNLERLVNLDLSWNSIRDEYIFSLIDIIKILNDFEYLNLEENGISKENHDKINNILNENNDTWYYNNKGEYKKKTNYLTKEKFADNYIQHKTTLNKENMNFNNFNYENLIKEFENLKKYKHVKNLIFIRQKVDNKIITLFSENLKFIEHLMELELGGNEIGDEGMIILSKGLNNSIELEILDLKENYIGSKGMKALSESLNNLKHLKILNLNWNSISDSGLIFFSKVNLPLLENLLLKENQIKESGMKIFSENLKNYPMLKYLDMGWNKIKGEGLKFFTQNMQHLSQLNYLFLSKNDIDEEGFLNFAQNIDKLPKLESIFFWNNKIKDESAEILLKYIKKNKRFKNIDLSINEISEDVKQKYRDYVGINKILSVEI